MPIDADLTQQALGPALRSLQKSLCPIVTLLLVGQMLLLFWVFVSFLKKKLGLGKWGSVPPK